MRWEWEGRRRVPLMPTVTGIRVDMGGAWLSSGLRGLDHEASVVATSPRSERRGQARRAVGRRRDSPQLAGFPELADPGDEPEEAEPVAAVGAHQVLSEVGVVVRSHLTGQPERTRELCKTKETRGETAEVNLAEVAEDEGEAEAQVAFGIPMCAVVMALRLLSSTAITGRDLSRLKGTEADRALRLHTQYQPRPRGPTLAVSCGAD